VSRFDYVRYDEVSQDMQEAAKEAVQEVELVINLLPEGRAKSLALTKLEECYMWIGKAVRDLQITSNGTAELQEERKNG
jgi:hypothetical protein